MGRGHRRGRAVVAVGIVLAGRMRAWLGVARSLTVAPLIFLLGMLLLACPCAFALDPALDVSQYAHTTWKIREGFANGRITGMAQTPDGYLWLGTDFGLLRFDGVRTVPWQPPAGQHLPDNFIRGLLAARDGTLWIGTLKGLASWKDGRLTTYEELAGRYVDALLEDRDGTVWASGSLPTGRVCAIRNGGVQCYGDDGSLGLAVESLYEDSGGNIWVGAATGLWRWKPGPPKLYPASGPVTTPQALIEGDNGALLISARSGMRRFVGGKVERYLVPGAGQRFTTPRLLRDRDGGLWMGTFDGGLVHVHEGRADVFTQSDGLSGEEVDTLFEDREGNIWVATINGLDRFRDSAVATFSVNQGLSSARVESVLAGRDGSVWLGTDGGLNRWTNGQITIPATGSGKRDGKLNGLNPQSLFRDDRGRIWIFTRRGLGYLENDLFIPVGGIPGGIVRSFAEDAAGTLWIANQDLGLFRLSPTNEVQQMPWARLGRKDFATALAADPLGGGLWLGFYQGGVAYLADGRVRASYAAADGLGEGRVSSLRPDRDGTLWAATAGGLSRLKNGRVATLTSKNGLPCDTVHWSIEDNAHSFWLYMACGLVRIARPELDAWTAAVDKAADKNGADQHRGAKPTIQATVFDSADGVRSLAVASGYSPLVTKSSDGKLWFFSGEGVSVADPRNLHVNKLPPPVHVEQITADRKTYDAASQLHLPPRVRDLEIDYTALSLVAPEKVLFRYKLEGRDSDWQDVGNRRQAFYGDLSPGNYRFRVMACNNSGVWNEAGTFLDFSVAPAYYQTNWFRVTCVAAFLVFLWGIHRLRLRQVAHEFDMRLEERVGERIRIARELHDSFLQGFQGLMFRLQGVRDLLPGRPTEAIQALDSALDRGDQVIAEGRGTVEDLRYSTVLNNDLVQSLTALGEELAPQMDNHASAALRVVAEGKQRDLDPTLRDEIYRVAREALRNAFRHAQAHSIEAEITYGDSQFLLRIRDDGNGIDPKVLGQGSRAGHWGLPGMRERAKRFGGQLEVWSEHGAGTEVELTIPASVAYGTSSARRRFWSLRNKNWGAHGRQS